jgi:hypothetical protein
LATNDEPRKSKLWVLDTDTKGTGARMVPLEDTLAKPSEHPTPIIRRQPSPEPGPNQPEPRRPRRFRVTDVLSGRVLAHHTDARATLDLLANTRSMVDVTIDVWDSKAGRWRRLSHGEKTILWNSRGER